MKLRGILLSLFALSSLASAAPVCSRADADRAEQAVDRLADWAAVGAARRNFGDCDSGSIAEGFSEAIARLLADQWATLPQLAQMVRTDPALQPFILRHLNSTLDTADLENIARQAAKSCPRGHTQLCGKLRAAANDALK